MSANNLLTLSMLAKQLNTGSATVRFWLNRFSKWLPYIEKDGEKLYQADTFHALKFISDKIDSGMVPSEIENELDAKTKNEQSQSLSPSINSFIPPQQSVFQEIPNLSNSTNYSLPLNESVQLISALFERFYSQQERIASAEERKAAAEEQKAEAERVKAEAEKIRAEAEHQKAQALIKRAEAELQKANAMNNLADAIKNIPADILKPFFSADSFSKSPFFESPQPITAHSQQKSDNAQSYPSEAQAVNSDENDKTDEETYTDDKIDDLSALIEDEATYTDDKIDDLSALIEDGATYADDKIDDLSALIENEATYADDKIDDLSALIEDEETYTDDKTDDLSALIENEATYADDKIDDLSALIEDGATYTDDKIDDLSALIENEATYADDKIDDLSALIEDEETYTDDKTDDLSALIEDEETYTDDKIDDLSALIEDDNHEIKPDILDSDVDDLMSLIDDDTKQLSNSQFLDQGLTESDIMDDLSNLIGDEEVSNLKPVMLDNDIDDIMPLIVDDKQDNIMDDLSAIIEAEKEEPLPLHPKIDKPKASIEDDFEKYKAEVINIIIKLRNEGNMVEQTTEILNNEGIKTLSGKNKWTNKMISKIYTFIEAAKK